MANSHGPASPATGVALSWEFAALTDVGRLRANNEDAIAVDAFLGLAIVADGMGGYNGGEAASGMAVSLLSASLVRWRAQAGSQAQPHAIRRALQAGVDESNQAIFDAAAAHSALRGMGTTLVVAVFGPQDAIVGHIGDSRCYRLRDGQLRLMTRDHSVLQEQLDAGLMTPEEAKKSPHRNLVTRALGIERHVELEMHEYDAQPADLYLLCSDGLSEMLPAADLLILLSQDIDLSEKTTLLFARANDNGGRDNISVVLALASRASAVAPPA